MYGLIFMSMCFHEPPRGSTCTYSFYFKARIEKKDGHTLHLWLCVRVPPSYTLYLASKLRQSSKSNTGRHSAWQKRTHKKGNTTGGYCVCLPCALWFIALGTMPREV